MKQTICTVGDIIYIDKMPNSYVKTHLADENETKIIYDYLCDRNKQFGTKIEIKNGYIEVKICD